MAAYYNEIDPFAAQWLRNLIAAGHIAAGDVDERSIAEIRPGDLAGLTRFHTFAGIGVWDYALRLAGWPDDAPVWTGSCPCQPFSTAGKQGGFDDERHLWPAWFRLIRECRPPVIFGEQVARSAGREWLDVVFADLEGEGYACAAADLCAASVGAPHIRQRLYFVAHNNNNRLGRKPTPRIHDHGASGNDVDGRLLVDSMAHPFGERREGQQQNRSEKGAVERGRAVGGAWADAEWVTGADGKSRPREPGVKPLVDGSSEVVERLRAYGNAIVAPVAAEFIRSVMEVLWNT